MSDAVDPSSRRSGSRRRSFTAEQRRNWAFLEEYVGVSIFDSTGACFLSTSTIIRVLANRPGGSAATGTLSKSPGHTCAEDSVATDVPFPTCDSRGYRRAARPGRLLRGRFRAITARSRFRRSCWLRDGQAMLVRPAIPMAELAARFTAATAARARSAGKLARSADDRRPDCARTGSDRRTLGITLTHEHVLIDSGSMWLTRPPVHTRTRSACRRCACRSTIFGGSVRTGLPAETTYVWTTPR